MNAEKLLRDTAPDKPGVYAGRWPNGDYQPAIKLELVGGKLMANATFDGVVDGTIPLKDLVAAGFRWETSLEERRTWFTADPHFGHKGILNLEPGRQAEGRIWTLEEMEDAIIDNINEKVRPEDILYILGDFSLKGPKHVRGMRSRINCKHVELIMGNHDDERVQTQDVGFAWVGIAKMVKVLGQEIYLSHCSHRVWPKMDRGAWHLYGHSHGHIEDLGRSTDVGVDMWNGSPVSEQEIFNYMVDRKPIYSDHHGVIM